jgi:hypothetical protein
MPNHEIKLAALDRHTPSEGGCPAPGLPGARPAPHTTFGLNSSAPNTLRLKHGGGRPPYFSPAQRRLLPIFASIFLVGWMGTLAFAQINSTPEPPPQTEIKHGKKEKPTPENVEWIWQYTPDDTHKDGRENDLVQDLRFRPLLEQFLTAPQTFWGTPIDGHPRSLAITALDHLSIPDKVLAEENRYVSISGCVVHFCPARGLLWIDLNGTHHLVVFAALDWAKEGRPTTDPAAEYTLWVFPNEPLSIAAGSGPGSGPVQHPPAALTKAIAHWAAEPLAGSAIVQNITHAILVDPDGTPHSVDPAALGVAPPRSATQSDTDSAPALQPRN